MLTCTNDEVPHAGRMRAQAGVVALAAAGALLALSRISALGKVAAASPGAERVPGVSIKAQRAWVSRLPPGEDYTISDLIVAGDALITTYMERGEVTAYDLRSRHRLWRRHFSRSVVRSLGASSILVKSDDRLLRIDARSGRTEWEHVLNDGFFGDGGWVAVAGHLACAVYYSADQTAGLRGLNRSTVLDLRNGEARPARLPVLPLEFGMDTPPRVLYQEPLAFWPSEPAGKPSPPHAYAVGCIDLATGRRVWRTALGSISNRRWPELHPPMSSLGVVCFFGLTLADGTSTELSWLDLNSGDELRRDKVPVDHT